MADTLELGTLLPGGYEAPVASGPEGGEACLIGKAPIYTDSWNCNQNGDGPDNDCNGDGCQPDMNCNSTGYS